MTRQILAVLLASFATAAVAASTAEDQPAIDACLQSWGKASPFKKGQKADTVIGTGVKVFGIGSGQSGHDNPTDKPELILVRPAVNVMGKSTIKLSNPNGWYCFRSNVTVAGKLEIEATCKAHIASAREDGTSVGAADESGSGVAVFGALRVTRVGCHGENEKKKK
ncbi:MAG TPA: hypothetical protein VFU92_06130 [Usitatibacter sp.]|nr:hypothetical protein [Usitatibacter sp.]